MKTPLIRVHFLLGLLMIGFACNKKPANLPSISDISQLRSAIQQRWIKGDTSTLSREELLQVLPKASPPFDSTFDGGGSFQVNNFSFTQVSRDYFYPDSFSLIISIADYASDSTAFYYLFERFQQMQAVRADSGQDSIFIPSGFIWTWHSETNIPDNQISYLEVGYGARYHLIMQTNHPTGSDLLYHTLERINWEELHL